jgi:hypothetical protein
VEILRFEDGGHATATDLLDEAKSSAQNLARDHFQFERLRRRARYFPLRRANVKSGSFALTNS